MVDLEIDSIMPFSLFSLFLRLDRPNPTPTHHLDPDQPRGVSRLKSVFFDPKLNSRNSKT